MTREKIVAGRSGSMNHGIGTRHGKAGIVVFFLFACAAACLLGAECGCAIQLLRRTGAAPRVMGQLRPPATGVTHHAVTGTNGSPLSATVNKTSYAPGENVIVTLRGGRSSSATNGVGGWVRGILYLNNVEIARSTEHGYPRDGGGVGISDHFYHNCADLTRYLHLRRLPGLEITSNNPEQRPITTGNVRASRHHHYGSGGGPWPAR